MEAKKEQKKDRHSYWRDLSFWYFLLIFAILADLETWRLIMTTARFRLVDTHLRRMFTFVKLEVEVRLFVRGFRSVIFADAVFTAADFSLADLLSVTIILSELIRGNKSSVVCSVTSNVRRLRLLIDRKSVV